jgi:hypothetical protein
LTSQDCKLGFIQATVRAAHPSWNFDQVFQAAVAQIGMKGGFERTEAKTPVKDGQDPAIARELGKHEQLKDSRSGGVADQLARLKKIRDLMTANPAMSWDTAFSQICQQEQAQPASTASLLPTAVQSDPVAIVQAQHPSWTEAQLDKWMWESGVWT